MALLMFRIFELIIMSFIVLIMYILHRKKSYILFIKKCNKNTSFLNSNCSSLQSFHLSTKIPLTYFIYLFLFDPMIVILSQALLFSKVSALSFTAFTILFPSFLVNSGRSNLHKLVFSLFFIIHFWRNHPLSHVAVLAATYYSKDNNFVSKKFFCLLLMLLYHANIYNARIF